MTKILIIEDDKSIQNSVSYYLTNEGFYIDIASNLKQGKEKIDKNSYDLLLLDVTFPDGNEFDFYKNMKKVIPTIFLTALDEEKDIVKGFDLGANDYITKPFHARELLSRIKNVLKYTSKEEKITIQNVILDLTKNKVFNDEKEVELTALEYKILLFMFENKGKLVTRGQILTSIWDDNNNFVNDNTLTVYIKRIREKIEKDPNNPKVIKTARGIGYRIGD